MHPAVQHGSPRRERPPVAQEFGINRAAIALHVCELVQAQLRNI
jgi:hypothetical protein